MFAKVRQGNGNRVSRHLRLYNKMPEGSYAYCIASALRVRQWMIAPGKKLLRDSFRKHATVHKRDPLYWDDTQTAVI
jgi:hypothetical protein